MVARPVRTPTAELIASSTTALSFKHLLSGSSTMNPQLKATLEYYEHDGQHHPRSLKIVYNPVSFTYRDNGILVSHQYGKYYWRFFKSDLPFVRSVYWILKTLPNQIRKFFASQLPCQCGHECLRNGTNVPLKNLISRLQSISIPKTSLDSRLPVSLTNDYFIGSLPFHPQSDLILYDFKALVDELTKAISFFSRPHITSANVTDVGDLPSEVIKIKILFEDFLDKCKRISTVFFTCLLLLGKTDNIGQTYARSCDFMVIEIHRKPI